MSFDHGSYHKETDRSNWVTPMALPTVTIELDRLFA